MRVSFPAGGTLGALGFVTEYGRGNVKNLGYLCNLAFVGRCCVLGFNLWLQSVSQMHYNQHFLKP